MKKMTSFLALVLALSIPSGAYAAEASLMIIIQLQMEMFMRSIQKMFHGTVCLLTTMEMLLLIFQMAQA